MFQIGDFAQLSGASAKMLRHYDRLGLFRPAWVDPSSGYRFYLPSQLPQLHRLIALKDLGIPLRELVSLVEEESDLRLALRRRRSQLEREQRSLERQLAALDIRVEMATGGSRHPDVVIRRLPIELVVARTVRRGEEADLGPVFYEIESHVRDHRARARRPPTVVNHLGGQIDVVVPITKFIPATDFLRVYRLPSTMAATVIHRGSYASLGSATRDLYRWLAGSGYRQAGGLRVVYLQFSAEPELNLPAGFLTDRSTSYVTELQQPIHGA